jgi:hypothetical protein
MPEKDEKKEMYKKNHMQKKIKLKKKKNVSRTCSLNFGGNLINKK